jgi:hypothetical protein
MILDGVDFRKAIGAHREKPCDHLIRSRLEEYRKQGVTLLRDGGDAWGVSLRARSLAAEYGIDYRSPGFPIYKKGHYGSFIGRGFETIEDYRRLLDELHEKQADFVKIMISGLMDFNQFGKLSEESLPAPVIKELVHIAHEEGFSVMAHANGAAAVEAAAAAGVDSVEHGAYLNRDALSAMASAGTVWVPTLSTVGNLRGTGRFDETAVAAILENALQNVSDFAAMGGLLAPGTDAGAWAVPHGSLTEFALLESVLGDRADAILAPGIETLIRKF